MSAVGHDISGNSHVTQIQLVISEEIITHNSQEDATKL